jgi:hypothetical protein
MCVVAENTDHTNAIAGVKLPTIKTYLNILGNENK